MPKRVDIKSLNMDELTEFIVALGEKPYRARQLYRWMHIKHAPSIDDMTDIPAAFRETLKKETRYRTLKTVKELESRLDGTKKYLFGLGDGNVIESVLMKYRHGNSACVSSQVGCRMSCRFCASTQGGFVRDLTASEMLEQVYRIQESSGGRVSNVVVMGSGEPFDNYGSLVRFIRILSDVNGLNISQRNITVSTLGLVPAIKQFSEEGLSVTLALSLHAADDEKRAMLMPAAKRYPLDEALDACYGYYEATGRRLSFEYALIKGINDSIDDARALARLLKDMRGHVNLIPINPVKESGFKQPERETVDMFKDFLTKRGLNVTVRRQMGRDINGACGQLRQSYLRQEDEGEWQ